MLRAIYIDKDRCVGCEACLVACKLEHNLPPYPVEPPAADPEGPDLIRVYQVGPKLNDETGYQYCQPIPCLHCLDAPCIEACPRSALYKDNDTGVTLVDQEKCIGCKFCLWVCPYGSPRFHNGRIYLCDLCIHRVGENREKGRLTACEAACPARAIHVGTPDEIAALTGSRAALKAGKEQRS